MALDTPKTIMANIVTKPNGSKHINIKLPKALGGRSGSIGITKLAELYHLTLIARIDAYLEVLKHKHRKERLPDRDRLPEVISYIKDRIYEFHMESMGMSDFTVTLNNEPIHVPATILSVTPTAEAIREPESRLELQEAVINFLQFSSTKGLSVSSLKAYRICLAQLVDTLGKTTGVTTIDNTMLSTKWLTSISDKAVVTQKNRIVIVKAFFGWLMDTSDAVPATYKNPAQRLQPMVEAKAVTIGDIEDGKLNNVQAGRQPFTEEEIKAILKGDSWLLKLGLYTGARINELAQLHREDININPETGHAFIRIDTVFAGQSLKNDASRRTIPLGFPEEELKAFMAFMDSVKTPTIFGETIGFQAATQNYAGASAHAKRVLLKILPNTEKTFHCFRHTMSTRLKYLKVNETMVKEFVGHKQQDITFGLYGKAYQPEAVYDTFKASGVWDY